MRPRPQRGKPITVHSRVRRTGPKKWSRVLGTVYEFRGEHPSRRRRRHGCAYVGMTAQPWRNRIRQHLYGDRGYGATAKPWADTIPGYVANAKGERAQLRAVDAVIAAGGARIVWQRQCFYWYLKVHESWSIAWRRPWYNISENLDNSRHVPKWDQVAQRYQRDQSALVRVRDADAGWRRLPDGSAQWYGHNAQSYRDSYGSTTRCDV